MGVGREGGDVAGVGGSVPLTVENGKEAAPEK